MLIDKNPNMQEKTLITNGMNLVKWFQCFYKTFFFNLVNRFCQNLLLIFNSYFVYFVLPYFICCTISYFDFKKNDC